jgi:uncharacterized protein YkwD
MRKLVGMILAATIASPVCAQAQSAAQAISQYRQQHGLGAVTADSRLMALAAEQANAMARAGVLDHSVSRPFGSRIAGYGPDVAVENIAAGTGSFGATLEVWKHSPGHDANLRRAGVTRFGIASAPAPQSRYKVFWALILAGSQPHGRLKAGAPGVMRSPGAGPVVRVRKHSAGDGETPGFIRMLQGR